jgi:hypothetical protein
MPADAGEPIVRKFEFALLKPDAAFPFELWAFSSEALQKRRTTTIIFLSGQRRE